MVNDFLPPPGRLPRQPPCLRVPRYMQSLKDSALFDRTLELSLTLLEKEATSFRNASTRESP